MTYEYKRRRSIKYKKYEQIYNIIIYLVDAGCAGLLLELGSRDAKPLAAVTALAADFNDDFSGVVL